MTPALREKLRIGQPSTVDYNYAFGMSLDPKFKAVDPFVNEKGIRTFHEQPSFPPQPATVQVKHIAASLNRRVAAPRQYAILRRHAAFADESIKQKARLSDTVSSCDS